MDKDALADHSKSARSETGQVPRLMGNPTVVQSCDDEASLDDKNDESEQSSEEWQEDEED